EYNKVVNVRNGIIELEINSPSKHDKEKRLSLIIRGGTWYLEDKKRSPKNAAAFRFRKTKETEDMMEQIAGFVSDKTLKLFFCEGREEDEHRKED
ncbi:MAG: hypothetical protein GWN64_05500, partial [Candidatus Thorarchaeota archaeon]|nr:hypothetical protein [Candidatus Thorarchaeota archaeon]